MTHLEQMGKARALAGLYARRQDLLKEIKARVQWGIDNDQALGGNALEVHEWHLQVLIDELVRVSSGPLGYDLEGVEGEIIEILEHGFYARPHFGHDLFDIGGSAVTADHVMGSV